MRKKLYLSNKNKFIAGICGGISESYGFEPYLVRIAFILLALIFRWLFLILYLVLWAVLPKSN